jgi:hypothetical protein
MFDMLGLDFSLCKLTPLHIVLGSGLILRSLSTALPSFVPYFRVNCQNASGEHEQIENQIQGIVGADLSSYSYAM